MLHPYVARSVASEIKLPKEADPMKRALVLGSQIEGLRGVDHDAGAMAELLGKLGFEVDLRTGERATREGMLAGYEALIAASADRDVAVVYYAGHGFYAVVPGEDLVLQCIAPTDLRAGSRHDFRGITAWELSILQHRLTQRTPNVTVILDCCHSEQMSRDATVREAIPRALPHPLEIGLAAHREALRARYGDVADNLDPIGNPYAVRVVACAQTETAHEYRNAAGAYCGVFTDTLLAVLRDVGEAAVSWEAVGNAVRARVLGQMYSQRPDVEGPARRLLFSLVEADHRGVVTLRQGRGGLELPVGHVTGVTVGDVYGIMPVGSTRYDGTRALAEVEVTEVLPLASRVAPRGRGRAPALPADAVAIPLQKAVKRQAVALAVDGPAREALARALEDIPTLRVAAPGEPGFATLRLAGDRLAIEDAGGPLFPPAELDDLELTVRRLANLGVLQSMREIEREQGVMAAEIEIELGVVEAGGRRPLRHHRPALGLRDRFYIEVRNRGSRQLYVHVFDAGIQGTVTLMTRRLTPAGFSLPSGGPPFILGRRANGTLPGIGTVWPAGLPQTGAPRLDEYFVFVTSTPVSLTMLETRLPVPSVYRGRGARLRNLLAQLRDGVTRDAALEDDEDDGFLVQRVSYLLHPRAAALGGRAD